MKKTAKTIPALCLCVFIGFSLAPVRALAGEEQVTEEIIAEEIITEEEVCTEAADTEEPEAAADPVIEEDCLAFEAAADPAAAEHLPAEELPAEEEVEEDDTVEEVVEADPIVVWDEEGTPDNDALFRAYFENLLRPRFRRPVGPSNLDGVDLTVYGFLSELTGLVAEQGGTTIFDISLLDIGTKLMWTQEELGGITIVSEGKITQEAKDAVSERLYTGNLRLILSALQQDQPFGMYWYDKTPGAGARLNVSYTLSAKSSSISISAGTATYSFSVAADYGSSYAVDAAQASRAQTAAENARAIVAARAESTDEEKLTGYRDDICALASYNTAAAHGSVPYGDPWQPIYVFDGDPETKVVCEGYAKAFEYLCDMSAFQSPSVSCISVTGWMNGEDHMWNIVTGEDGENVLADITNSDGGQTAKDKCPFLIGYSEGNIWDGYVISYGRSRTLYQYSDSAKALLTEEELTLAREDMSTFRTTLNMADFTGVNVYVTLTEGADAAQYTLKAEPEKSMYPYAGREVSLGAITPNAAGEYYVADVMKAASTEMTDTVKVTLLKNGKEVKSETYSVYSIVMERLESGELDEKREALNRALVQYGRYAQIRFDHKTDCMPDPDPLAPALVEIPDSYAAKGDPTGFGAYITNFEAKIEMADAVKMNVYLTPAAGYGIDDFEISMTCAGALRPVMSAPGMRGGKIFVQISGLLSYEMDKDVRITVKLKNSPSTSAVWTRSLITCAYENSHAATATDARRDLMMSLYQYFLAARNRFLP